MSSLIGKEIGKYRITQLLGRGGMAEVYIGVDTHLDRQIAVKVLHSYLLEEGGAFIERFRREAKAIAKLRHPNIVQVHDFDIQDDLIFMVMEYIDGSNLQKRLEQLYREGKRFPFNQAGSIISDIAKALDYAHSQGILHRDIKPSNILIDKNGNAYLTDFGIARIVGDQKLTATGMLIGTPAYMSPEQCMGEDFTDESDIYSLGIVAFEILTGQVPFDAQTPIAIVHKQITEPIPNISNLVEDVPENTQEIVYKALAKSPAERYSTANEFATALKAALQLSESVETSLPELPSKELDADKGAYYAPTVVMEDAPLEGSPDQFETTLVENEKPAQIPAGIGSLGEKETQKDQAEAVRTKREKPLWAVYALVLVLLGASTIFLPKIFSPRQPTAKPEVTLTEPVYGEPAPSEIVQNELIPAEATESEPTVREPAATPSQSNEYIRVVFDVDHLNGELITKSGYMGDFEVVRVGEDQELAWRTGNGRILPSTDGNLESDHYMAFMIENDAFFQIPTGRLVRIEVEYLDEGTDIFNIQYDAHFGGPYGNGIFKDTKMIQKTNSGEFKIAVFDLYDANFAHRNNGDDFRLDDRADGAETIRRLSVMLFPKETVSVVFDAKHTDEGLLSHSQFDYDVEVVTVGEDQELAWRTGNGRVLPSSDGNLISDFYMEFIIRDDALLQIPAGRLVRIEIEYLDEGTDTFRIDYDAHDGGPYGDGTFKPTELIHKTGSGEFKAAVFELYDANFLHRNNDSDFRISDLGDGAETIRRVKIRLFP